MPLIGFLGRPVGARLRIRPRSVRASRSRLYRRPECRDRIPLGRRPQSNDCRRWRPISSAARSRVIVTSAAPAALAAKARPRPFRSSSRAAPIRSARPCCQSRRPGGNVTGVHFTVPNLPQAAGTPARIRADGRRSPCCVNPAIRHGRARATGRRKRRPARWAWTSHLRRRATPTRSMRPLRHRASGGRMRLFIGADPLLQ